MGLSKLSLKIGTKLSLMSGLGIALVAIMIGISVWSSNEVDKATEDASRQQSIATDLAEIIAGIRSTQVVVRDIRLSDRREDIQKYRDQSDVRSAATADLLDKVVPKFKSPANRERAEKIRQLFGDYAKGGKEIAQVKMEMLTLGDSPRRDQLGEHLHVLIHDRTMVVANQMVSMAEEGVSVAKATAATYVKEANDELAKAQFLMLAVGSVVILILIGAAIFGAVSIARPLARLVPELKKLAEGDFNVAIHGIGRKDEVGQIAEAAEMVADRVGSTIVNIKMSASEVTNASAEISTSTTDLSQRTEEQAASLEETSASMEEMTATVKKNAENAKQASELATSTREVADRGGEVVAKTVDAMAKIEESSRKISDIIIVIDEIARQTNLLALNAAVEAARAGDAGRGFAVVASEVRSLAQRSSQAAKDIKDLITSSTNQVNDGVELVNKAGESLTEIVESIKKVTVVVTEIANASMEQSTGIEQINRALTQMDEVTQQNSALVEENAATAKTLEQQAKSMDERVAIFKVRGSAAPTPAPRPAAERPVAVAPVPHAEAAPVKRPAKVAANGSRMNGANRGPVGRMQAGLAVALKEDDWKEF